MAKPDLDTDILDDAAASGAWGMSRICSSGLRGVCDFESNSCLPPSFAMLGPVMHNAVEID